MPRTRAMLLPMLITLKSNSIDVAASLDRVARDQIPFASALALTRLANDARADVRGSLNQFFNIRRGWVAKGIQTEIASKRDWPMQQSVVGTKNDFMARQELGGDKTGRSGKMLAMPTTKASERSDVTTPGKWPSRLLAKGGKRKYFVQKLKTGPNAGRSAVMRRTGNGATPLQVLYILKSKVHVPAHWRFRDTVERTVQGKWSVYFGQALARALATAK